ncbi:MAG: sialidase family protein [Planctomycetota bacterium]|nr:sialidase family protein [Planctomycetota bacterium]
MSRLLFLLRTLSWLLPCSCSLLFSQETQPELVECRKIWSRGPHNAFTDLLRFNDKFYCVFREGNGHVSPDGALRVLVSDDGNQWKSAALITSNNSDLRDAKLTITPQNQLMLSGAEALNQPKTYKHQSLAWFSKDGVNWSQRHEIGDRDYWLWRTSWYRGKAYAFGYGCKDENRSIRLYRSDNGKRFEPIVKAAFTQGYPNETSMVFRDNGTCYCLLRRDGDPGTAQIGKSVAPYTNWDWKDLGIKLGGPHMIQLPDGRLIAAVRLYDGKTRTALGWIDPVQATFKECLKLPSGGDTSYAGLVWHNQFLWISYYSSHEGKTSIYLAKVKFK